MHAKKSRSLTGSRPCGGLQRENRESALSIYKNCSTLAAIAPHGPGLQKLRRCTIRQDREKLSGRVEVDEFFIGGQRSGKRGRGAEGKAIVFIAVERSATEKRMVRIRLHVALDCSGYSLETFILENIAPFKPANIIRTSRQTTGPPNRLS